MPAAPSPESKRPTRLAPSPLLGVQLLFARAVLALDGDAEERYRDTLAQDLVRWPWVHARIELAYGSWLRRQRRAVESGRACSAGVRDPGVDRSARMGRASPHRAPRRRRTSARRARRRGRRPRGRPLPQELEIARLAEEGLCEPRDRPTLVPLAPHGGFTPVSHLPQAGDHVAPAPPQPGERRIRHQHGRGVVESGCRSGRRRRGCGRRTAWRRGSPRCQRI